MTVSEEYALAHLRELFAAVEAGIPVEIDRGDKPTMSLQAQPASNPDDSPRDRVLGAGKGLLRIPTDAEWEQMDKEWRASFIHRFEDSAA